MAHSNTNDGARRAGTWIEAMARLPWWACIAVALLSYLALHALALRPYTIVVDPGDVRAALAAFLVGGSLEVLEYVVPALCLSALLARLARIPAEAVRPGTAGYAADAGNGMTAWEFERLTSGGLRIVRRTGKRSAALA